MERFRHQLSGGQLQRVVIAMALLTNPALLVMDEPTTSLDVTVEAGILDLIEELKRESGVTILFISHNLGVISRVTDRVAVMYSGELVEQGPVADMFRAPRHPYTAALLKCVPKITAGRRPGAVQPIRGRVPALHETPRGCVFEPRCDRARERCRVEHPGIAGSGERTQVRCFFPGSPNPAEAAGPQTASVDAEPPAAEEGPILKIEGVRTYYSAQHAGLGGLGGRRTKGFVKAVDDVTLTARKTATVGIVGESGCGKSTLAKCIAGLESPNAGTMDFIGVDIARVVEQRPVELLEELQMIFQNPDSTLNPKRTVGEAIARPLQRFGTVPGAEIGNEVVRLLEAVRLGEGYLDRLPRQLSGGEKQRVALARAFAGRPTLVLCDEPLSSLDVSVQAAVMNLLLEFQRRFETTMLFISHDLSVVYQFCDSVAVMYLGRICEVGPTEALFAPPYHPYTEALLSAVPIPDPSVDRSDIRLAGAVPSALDPPVGLQIPHPLPAQAGHHLRTRASPMAAGDEGTPNLLPHRHRSVASRGARVQSISDRSGGEMTDPVTEFYDRLSPEYRDNMGWDWESVVRSEGVTLHRFLEDNLRREGPCKLLDCTCGTGTQAIGLALAGHEVHGSDLSPASVERARREALGLGVSMTFSVADFRDLAATISETFDAVISCDNAIAHCLDDDDLRAALTSIRTRLVPGGLLLLSLRDYDALLAEKLRFNNEHVHDKPDGRRIAFQVWDWADDERSYRNHQFLIGETDGTYAIKHFETELRVLRRCEILAAAADAGYGEVRWHPPDSTGYYQPIVTGRNG